MTDWTLAELAEAIRARRVSPVEVTRAYLERIGRLDGTLRAYITVDGARLRAVFTRQFIAEVFGRVDLLLTAVIPEPAPALAVAKSGSVEDVAEKMGRFSRLTRPFNALGFPALSVPCGFSADGRPLALQLVGRPFAEATVLGAGHAYERATDWHRRRPALD